MSWPAIEAVNETMLGTVLPNESFIKEASQWNFTKNKFEDITIDANFAWLIFSLWVGMTWIIYITHYNARVLGQIVTRICNRFITEGYINIGKLFKI